jgi:signal transduction histidine kinase
VIAHALKIPDQPIARKLTAINLLVSAVALVLACTSFFAYDLYTFRTNIVRNLSIESQMIGANSIASLTLADPYSAQRTLSALRASPHIFYAEVYTADGRPFAGYWRDNEQGAQPLPPAAQAQDYWFERSQVSVMRPIVYRGKLLGTVLIRSDLRSMTDRLKNYALIICVVVVASLLAAFFVSRIAQRAVSQPVIRLAETARIVSRDKNYSVRAAETGREDEVATLIESFNNMLSQIQQRDNALQLAHDELEIRVKQRTAELAVAQDNLRALSGRLLQMQDEERRHIARELHDGSGQVLAALAMDLSLLQTEAAGWGPKAAAMVAECLELTQTILKDLRTMSYLLHPPLLDEIGLESALSWFVSGFSERSGIPVQLEIPQPLARLSRDLETALFRIVQESLTNIHRHSGSSSAIIRLCRDGELVRLEVLDRGQGLPQSLAQGGSGVGIQGMQERVRQLGGSFKIQSGPGGATVIAVLPAQPQDADDSIASRDIAV